MFNECSLDLLHQYDFLACPRCSNGVFFDDELGFELLIMLGLPQLLCPFCFFEYHASFYLDDDLHAVRGELDV